MSPYRAVLLALFAVGVVAVLAGATPGADASVGTGLDADADRIPDAERAGPPDARQTTAANDTAGNSSLGADISSFMQSSAAEIGGTVDNGMWTAAFDATRNESVRVALVERRTAELRERLAALERRKAELVAEREADEVSETAYEAKVSHLVGRIDAFESAVDAVSERAEQVGTGAELESLRTGTANLTGPAVAAITHNLTGVGLGDGDAAATATTGPPDGRSVPADSSDEQAGAAEPPDERTAPTAAYGGATGALVETETVAVEIGGIARAVTSPTRTAGAVTPPTDLADRVGSAVDAATDAVDRALAAIPV